MKKSRSARKGNQKKVPTEHEFRFINKKRKIKNTLLKIGMIPGTNKSIALLMDITTRKYAEELFKNLFTDSPNAIFLIQDKKIKWWTFVLIYLRKNTLLLIIRLFSNKKFYSKILACELK